jgi:hypothetical protein
MCEGGIGRGGNDEERVDGSCVKQLSKKALTYCVNSSWGMDGRGGSGGGYVDSVKISAVIVPIFSTLNL